MARPTKQVRQGHAELARSEVPEGDVHGGDGAGGDAGTSYVPAGSGHLLGQPRNLGRVAAGHD